MGGAAAGAAIDGGSGALNGADISSALQQYNQARYSPQVMQAMGLGGVALAGQQGNLDQALTDLINAIHNPFANYGKDQAQAMGQALMGMAMLAQSAPDLYNQLTQAASQSAEQYGQYIDLMKQLGATVYGSFTIDPDAGKGTTLTTPITENKGTTLTTPISEQDKNSGIMADPIHDENQGWTETVTANSDAGKGTIVTSTPWLNPDGSLIGQQDKGGRIEVNGNADPNQAAWDFVQKAIGGKGIEKVTELNINGIDGAKKIELKDGTFVTYRPAGAASSKTDSTTATVEVNNDAAKESNNGRPLKIKFNP